MKTPLRLIVISLLLSFALLTLRLDALWFGQHEENGRWVSTAVRNYALYGADELHYLITTDAAPSSIDELYVYVHHPPLLVWMVNVAAHLFGRYEADSAFVAGSPYELSARMVTIFASMISLAAFYVIVRRLYPLMAVSALLLYAFTPMTLYYGRMVNHEPLALAFLYLFLAVFLNWLKDYSHQRTLALILLAGLGVWTTWTVLFFFVAIGLLTLIYGKQQHRLAIVLIGFTTLLLTLAIPAYYMAFHADTVAKLNEAFFFRTSNQSLSRGSESFTLLGFIGKQAIHMLTAMSFGLMLFGIVGFMGMIRQKIRFETAFVLALLAAALLYMLIFRNAFYVHDYYKIYFMPSFAIAAAWVVQRSWQAKRVGFKRYLRPLIVSLLLCSWVLGGVWFGILHRSGMESLPKSIIRTVLESTPPHATILSNLNLNVAAYDYYTYRRFVWGMDENAVLDSPYPETWYLYCELEDTPPLRELAERDFIPIETICRLIALKEGD